MIDQFANGYITPALSFLLSCIGCAAGLSATTRAHISTGGARIGWLLVGAFAIGATGIWVMHFVAMLGVAVEGAVIRYDLTNTILSALLSVLVVGIGLFVVDRSGGRLGPLLVGGVIAGLGVAGMHYLGMDAMHIGLGVGVQYATGLVVLSVAIAVVAATVGLWLATNVRGVLAGLGATIVMAIAVSGMHYTGMAAMSTHRVGDGPIPPSTLGVPPDEFLIPLIVGITAATVLLMIVVMVLPSAKEIERQAKFDEWRARNRAVAEQPVKSKLL